MRGTINIISVAGMLRLLCSYGKTGVLNIDSGKIKGHIDILDGSITDVTAEKFLTKPTDKRHALVQLLLAIEEGSFYFEEKKVSEKPALNICVEDVILESAREIYYIYLKELSVKDLIFPENEVLKMSRLSKGRKLNLSINDEEWNLMAGFNGDNNIASVFDGSGIDRPKAEVILFGLVSSGLVRRMRFKIPEMSRIAKETLGNIGAAIVDTEFQKQRVDKTKMGMRSFIGLLNALEVSFGEILGKTSSKEIIEKIWSATK